jgi:hypothetical protein
MIDKNPKPIAPVSDKPANASGMKVTDVSSAPSKNTKLMPKKNVAAGNPTLEAKPSRKMERAGASYGIRVSMPAHQAPEAGLTQANGRLFTASINRSRPNFQDAVNESVSR